MNRRTYLALAGTMVAGGLAGCSSGSDNTVEMTDDLRFEPGTLSVSTGTTVEWRNAGSVDHTVTAYGDDIPDDASYFASGGFDDEASARANLAAGLIGADESYSHTFEVTGEYPYYCIPHEGSGMTGTITVE